jgi:sigma-E factor negative regulatory protein RseA
MNEHNEKVSGLMDDYYRTEQDQSVLDGVLQDVNQLYTLRRYQLIRDVMRNELPERIQLDFVDRVKAEIARQPVLDKSPVSDSKSAGSEPSWLWSMLFKPVAGLAVAATVAVVLVSNVQLQSSSDAVDGQIAAVTPSAAKVEQLANLPIITNARRVATGQVSEYQQPGMHWKVRRDEVAMQNKLNTYLINHNEYSNPMQGIIPQVRVVGFDAQQ